MIRKLFCLVLLSIYNPVSAASATCPDAEVLSGHLIEDVCWECMFPIVVAGIELGGGTAPQGAASGTFCSCQDSVGLPRPGLIGSMWEPARLIEVVRGSGCSPSLGGMRLPLSDVARQGHLHSKGDGGVAESVGFLHYHYYAFPLAVMMEMMIDGSCNQDGYTDFDLLYFSEIDPSYNHEELAFFTHPEAAAIADPNMIMACTADAAAANTGQPIDEMFWCAGSWGTLYPFSGFYRKSSTPVAQNLLATRAVASLHRRGLAWKTMGEASLCDANIYPTLPKSQYKLNYYYPEAEANSSHVIGEHDSTWGSGRITPGIGEDAVLMLFRWNDCCVLF